MNASSIEPRAKEPLKRNPEFKDDLKQDTRQFELCKSERIYPNVTSIKDQYNNSHFGVDIVKRAFLHDLILRSNAETLLFLTSPLGENFIWNSLKDAFQIERETILAYIRECDTEQDDLNLPGTLGRFGFHVPKSDNTVSVPVYIKMNSDGSLELYKIGVRGLKVPYASYDKETHDLVVSDPNTNVIYLNQIASTDSETVLETYQVFSIIEKIVSVYSMVDPSFVVI